MKLKFIFKTAAVFLLPFYIDQLKPGTGMLGFLGDPVVNVDFGYVPAPQIP
jgi:hypothetical protein